MHRAFPGRGTGKTNNTNATMISTMQPWKTLSATVELGVLTDGWTLAEPPIASLDDARTYRHPVSFDAPFHTTPVVHLGLTGFDVDQRDTSRLRLRATDITPTGFTAEVITWHDTRVYFVEFSWLAVGA